jgi:hypothetical protein
MTSEVVVMNRLAVALAADSAVTAAGQKKVHNSANKLFMLSATEPVGVMVYNNAALMSLPWETLIKEYRRFLGDRHFDKLEGYGEDFIAFILRQTDAFGREAQKRFFLDLVESHFEKIVNEIRRKVDLAQSAFTDPVVDREAERGRIYRETIEAFAAEWSHLPRCGSLNEHSGMNLATECSSELAQLTTKKFKIPNPQLGNVEVTALRQLAIDLVDKDCIPIQTLTGLVIAGFGRKDFYPVLQVFEVGDFYEDKLKIQRKPIERIDDEKATHVAAFADSDTANAFLNGIPPEFERKIIEWAYEVTEELSDAMLAGAKGMSVTNKTQLGANISELREELLVKFVDKIEEHKNQNYVWQAEDAIINLPKDELAHVAAALVNINLLKKRMSMSLETVGGPIDVAVISKGDGFIWIDRKHYFSASKNPHYLRNRFGGSSLTAAEVGGDA